MLVSRATSKNACYLGLVSESDIRIVTCYWQNSYYTPLYVACAYFHWCNIVNSPAKFRFAMSSLGSKTRGNEVTRYSKFN